MQLSDNVKNKHDLVRDVMLRWLIYTTRNYKHRVNQARELENDTIRTGADVGSLDVLKGVNQN